MQDGVLLLLVQALEMVGLHAVRSQHALLRGGVLGHEVVREGEVDLVVRGVLQVSGQVGVAVALLLRHLKVSLLRGHKDVSETAVVLLLSRSQDFVVLARQVVLVFISPSLVFFVELLFGDLLLNPVLLL
jgi:hypothetical protein